MRACVLAALLLCACSSDSDDRKAGDQLDTSETTSDVRVCAAGATTKGVDVSKWNGSVDWTKAYNAGVRFAFIRVSDGVNTHDAKFASYWAGAKSAGVIRGAYQFFRPTQSATAQADLLVDSIGGAYTDGDLPPVIDVEDDGGLSPSTVAARVRTWVDRVHARLGVDPIVYTGKYFWRDEVGGPSSFAGNPLWIAQYTSLCPDLPGPWASWTFWQYAEDGTVSGISGDVDMDRFNGSLDQLKALAHATPTRPVSFAWTRNTDASYDFTVSAPADVAAVELRVEGYLIGTASLTGGLGSVHYTFNVATTDRAIEAKATDGSALGNGLIDSVGATSVFARQTGEHEYEIGLERAPASWATVEVSADGYALTDLDTGAVRSDRLAVRYAFNGLGERALKIVARNSAGTIVSTRTRTLTVR